MPGGLVGTGSRGGLIGIDDIGAGQVGTADIADSAVTTAKIASNAVGDTDLRDSAALSVIGRSANSSGDPADIAATAGAGGVLRESGNTIGFGTITLAAVALASTGRIPYSDGTTLVSSAELTYTSSTGIFDVVKSHSGGTVFVKARNSSNTASSAAVFLAEVAGGTADDAVYRATVSGVTTWTWGVDNSDSDTWKLGPDADVGANPVISVTTAGLVGLGGAPGVNCRFVVTDPGTTNDTFRAVCTQAAGSAVCGTTANLGQGIQWHADGSGVGGSLFGVTRASAAFFRLNATATALVIGTDGANPLVFGTNNTEVARASSASHMVMARRFQGKQGADVASAATITLGNGNYFDVTGATAIDFITTTDWQAGSVVTLQFDSNPTINHNTGSPPANTGAILLAGAANFASTASDTLTLLFDGTTWREVARTVI